MNYFKMRDRDLMSGNGTKEIKAIFEEIDDARTEKDLPKVKVLEVGAGCGMTMLRLKKEFGIVNIKGIDKDKKAVEYCQKRGLDVVEMFGSQTTFKDKEFDFVYGQHLLDGNIERDSDLVNEALRIGKKVILVVGHGIYPKKQRMKLYKKLSPCRRWIKRNIVNYTIQGVDYRNDLILLKSKQEKKKEKKYQTSTWGDDMNMR
ncbi:MAG: methyltransferase domain-containing protein [Thermoplasmata archaeon]|nr:methyltransferase domain-containing protein [Thermoplasmata archaeon]